MNKTFILRIEEINYFSIKVEAETVEKAEEIAQEDLGQFKAFNEQCDWKVTNAEEKS